MGFKKSCVALSIAEDGTILSRRSVKIEPIKVGLGKGVAKIMSTRNSKVWRVDIVYWQDRCPPSKIGWRLVESFYNPTYVKPIKE